MLWRLPMKKSLAILAVVLCLAVVLAGCGNNSHGNTAVNNSVNNTAVNNAAANNTVENSAVNNTANTSDSGPVNNTANNTANTAPENTASNTENNAANVGGYGSGDTEPDAMDLISGNWYDQISYGILKIDSNGECEYSSYSGDFLGSVAPSSLHSSDPMNEGLLEYDLRLSGGMEELPNLFYDEEKDVVYFELGGDRNLFSHEEHPYEPIDWVYAMFGEDMLWLYNNAPEYKADTSEYARVVIFDTTREVKDFYFTNVSLTGIDDKGQPVFQCEPLFMINKLEPMKGFVVRMSFPGDTPSNGIMYTDPISGEVRQFTISLSGLDGSLVLSEFH